MACAENILMAKEIVEADPQRRFVVVSAPGKCAGLFERKITDLLIDAHAQLCFADVTDSLDAVLARFCGLAIELGIDMDCEIERVREEIIINKCDYDFVISRGEYLMAQLFAKVLGYTFLDAANYVAIKSNGRLDEKATAKRLSYSILNTQYSTKTKGYVMGGFYGTLVPQGSARSAGSYRHGECGVKTFTRGGSDYSGAIAAVCLGAQVYENFTDTYGVQSANPALVSNTTNIAEIDYATLHKLCLGGATVIHPATIPLLKKHGVPLRVDNTFDPGQKFTLVTNKKPTNAYFSITYETKQNINKDTVEILCIYNKIEFGFEELRKLLCNIEVYLVEFTKASFRLLTTAGNLCSVVRLLHATFLSKQAAHLCRPG